jgi:hypothetical protein
VPSTPEKEIEMRRILLVLAAALLLPATASAKEIEKVVVCGAAGCQTVDHPGHAIADGGTGGGRVPPPGPYYSIELFVGDGVDVHESWTNFYAPRAGRISYAGECGDFVWAALPSGTAALYRQATVGLDPFPTPRFRSILVGGRAVADPQSYVRLLTVRSAGTAYPDEADWQRLELRADRENPWSLSKLEYSPATNVLVRGWEFVRLDPELAARVEARESLGSSPSNSHDRPLLSGSVLVAAALGLAAILLVRRGRPARPGTA